MKAAPVSETLRKKLVDLGIPLERQDATSLTSLFPPKLKVADFGLNQTDIAEVLIAFVKHGLISLSSISNAAAARLHAGARLPFLPRRRKNGHNDGFVS